jgi:hypothetical protein
VFLSEPLGLLHIVARFGLALSGCGVEVVMLKFPDIGQTPVVTAVGHTAIGNMGEEVISGFRVIGSKAYLKSKKPRSGVFYF